MDWRFDDSDEEEFEKGFQAFVKERKIKTYKKGDPVPEHYPSFLRAPDDDLPEMDDQD